jgi:hypothetical protein
LRRTYLHHLAALHAIHKALAAAAPPPPRPRKNYPAAINQATIADTLGLSHRQVQRETRVLRSLGAPLESDAATRRCWYSARWDFWRALAAHIGGGDS